MCVLLDDSYDQPTTSEIKAGDEVRYTPSGEGASEERAVVLKVHPDVDGAHYTIRTLGKDGKEKNTEASRISKVSEVEWKAGALYLGCRSSCLCVRACVCVE